MRNRKRSPSGFPPGKIVLAWQRMSRNPGIAELHLEGECSPDSLRVLRAATLLTAHALVRGRVISRAEAQKLRDGNAGILGPKPEGLSVRAK
jgi:hypothetical protein